MQAQDLRAGLVLLHWKLFMSVSMLGSSYICAICLILAADRESKEMK